MQPDESAIARIVDHAIAGTAEARKAAHRKATELLAANDNTTPDERVRYRGNRPAWNWLSRKDAKKAAALWLVARGLLPADNDNHAPELEGVDTRKDGSARGPRQVPVRKDYIDLPASFPSPLTATGLPRAVAEREWHNAAGFVIKEQRPDMPFAEDCRFGFCAPAVAEGAWFMAASGLGSVKKGKSRGDIRRVEEPEFEIPDAVRLTIEAVLSRATLGRLGEMHGYAGQYATRQGRRLMMEAGAWAVGATQAQVSAMAA
jgi:hypothetical protein